MVGPKRKSQSLGLNRRVRPRREEDWEPEAELNSQQSDNNASEEDISEQDSDNNSQSDVEDKESNAESNDEAPLKVDLSSVSFGALASAQAYIPATSRRTEKSQKPKGDIDPDRNEAGAVGRRRRSKAGEASRPVKPPRRASKHAPQELTSKRPVSRRREVVSQDTESRGRARDPRFDPLMGRVDEEKTRRAYAFLDEYRASETAELRRQITKARKPVERDALRRQLHSMESRARAVAARDEADGLLRRHRAREKDLVARGKRPFYLKRSEQKKQLLTDRFATMSEGQVDRAIERKRKKMASKEKKELDGLVRVKDRR